MGTFINVPIYERKNMTMKPTVEKKENISLKVQRDKDREMVRGIFIFHEAPGAYVEFVYKAYRGDEVEKYVLHDGETYTIPLGVAKHLNKNLWYPLHAHMVDKNGRPVMTIGQKVRRASFQSLEFVDTADLTPQGKPLVSVEEIHQPLDF